MAEPAGAIRGGVAVGDHDHGFVQLSIAWSDFIQLSGLPTAPDLDGIVILGPAGPGPAGGRAEAARGAGGGMGDRWLGAAERVRGP